ncbi:hypothetical protein G6F66_014347 [Rhizopus arrhizus]|nr:hypothetical protein G6F66_014347 [Rhizopus arrhizus]
MGVTANAVTVAAAVVSLLVAAAVWCCAPAQPLLLFDHIRCAAFELPFRVGDGFGPIAPEVFLEALAETEVSHREGERWEWIADSYPANAVSLRAVADGNFVVVDRSDGRQQIIAEVDYSAAALTLYEGAIHMVQSTPYQHRLHQAQGAGPLRWRYGRTG